MRSFFLAGARRHAAPPRARGPARKWPRPGYQTDARAAEGPEPATDPAPPLSGAARDLQGTRRHGLLIGERQGPTNHAVHPPYAHSDQHGVAEQREEKE